VESSKPLPLMVSVVTFAAIVVVLVVTVGISLQTVASFAATVFGSSVLIEPKLPVKVPCVVNLMASAGVVSGFLMVAWYVIVLLLLFGSEPMLMLLRLAVGALTVIEYAWLPVNGPVPVLESVAVIVKFDVPDAVGAPLMRPVSLLRYMPVGSEPLVTA